MVDGGICNSHHAIDEENAVWYTLSREGNTVATTSMSNCIVAPFCARFTVFYRTVSRMQLSKNTPHVLDVWSTIALLTLP